MKYLVIFPDRGLLWHTLGPEMTKLMAWLHLTIARDWASTLHIRVEHFVVLPLKALWQSGHYLKMERPSLFRWREASFRGEIRLGKSQFECALTCHWMGEFWTGRNRFLCVYGNSKSEDSRWFEWSSTFNVLVGEKRINKNKKKTGLF